MHMADALISPEVGGVMWIAGGAAVVRCSRKVKEELDDFRVPLMGVMGAFVFAAQMINFTIPGTGSSGHIVGALLLSVFLGPSAALLAISSVLVVQALFFADGGLLALGCNIFNMGVVPCLVAYPLVYKPIAAGGESKKRIWAASLAASVSALSLGACCVVLETWMSGISELPFLRFLLLMLPIHIAIGCVEGAATAAVVVAVKETRPELLLRHNAGGTEPLNGFSFKRALLVLGLAALLTAGVFSWFASENPDGLEWSISKITGNTELADHNTGVKSVVAAVRRRTSVFPDYALATENDDDGSGSVSWGEPNPGGSVAGIAGALFTLLLAFSTGLLVKRGSGRAANGACESKNGGV
jgi:cobalt/nickel transport system permease protein